MNAKQSYGLVYTQVTRSKTVIRDTRCYGFVAINQSDVMVWVNGIPLKPFPPGHPELTGESFGFVDPERKLYNNDFVINFATGATVSQLMLIQVYCAESEGS